MANTCAHCLFWEPILTKNNYAGKCGWCRVSPPRLERGDGLEQLWGAWPKTKETDWCGAFQWSNRRLGQAYG